MSTGSVQLNQTTQAVANSSNSATITFPAARLGRILQGSVSVAGSPPGTAWTVKVGGGTIGTLFAPGPFGPVQILSGQALSLTASNVLVSGNTYVATLSGVDDPSGNPSPYNGPSSVTYPGNQGGLLKISASSFADAVSTPLLAAPPAGFAYRIHTVVMSLAAVTNTVAGVITGEIFGNNIGFAISNFSLSVPVGTSQQPFVGPPFLANGLLMNEGINFYFVWNSGTFSSTQLTVNMAYDLVAI